MSQVYVYQETENITAQASWKGLYRIAGAGALVSVVLMLLDIALSFLGGDVPVGAMTAADWFAHLQQNGFVGLRNLGLFNVVNLVLAIPLYLAMYHLHHRDEPAYAALALILCVVSAAIYCSNNQALSLLALSGQYAQAVTEAQKSLLLNAGAVLLAQAEDFTPGAFLGFFLSSAASLLLMAVMLRGSVFPRRLALTGLAGTTLLLIFTITATFIPALFDLVMPLAILGGLLMLVWNISVALSLFRLGGAPRGAPRLAPRQMREKTS